MSNPNIILRATPKVGATVKGSALTASEHDSNAWNAHIKTRRIITPEQYGAVGDGVADDAPALRAMLAEMVSMSPVHVVMRPTNYYSLRSKDPDYEAGSDDPRVTEACLHIRGPQPSLDATFEGSGLERPTMTWEGSVPLQNIIVMSGGNGPTARSCRFEGICIEGQPQGSAGAVENIVRFTDTNFTIWRHCQALTAWGAGWTGFNWLTRFESCIAQGIVNSDRTGTGFGPSATMAFFSQCYANVTDIGFRVFTRYGGYYANAADWCRVAYKLEQAWSLDFSGNGAEQCLKFIEGEALAITINGFSGEQVPPDNFGTGPWARRFPEYNTGDPCPDHPIDLTVGSATTTGTGAGIFCKEYNRSGTWIKAGPRFTVDSSVTAARIHDFHDLDDRPTRTHILPIGYRIPVGPLNDFETAIRSCTGAQMMRWMDRRFTADPESIEIPGPTLAGVYGGGHLMLAASNGASPQVVLNSTFIIRDCSAQITFRDLRFTKNFPDGSLFTIENSPRVRFQNCRFDGNGSGSILAIQDPQSHVQIDAETMGNETGTWPGFGTFNGGSDAAHCVSFRGYTSHPDSGTFPAGARAHYATPDAGASPGAICTTGGTPGTWRAMAGLALT